MSDELPGYDEWKTRGPDDGPPARRRRFDPDDPDAPDLPEEPEPDTCHECGELAVGYDDGTPLCARCYRSRPPLQSERIECPSCGEIVEQLEAEGICLQCWKRMVFVADHYSEDPDPEEDEPDDADATPLIEGDDPDDHIDLADDYSPLFRDLGNSSGG